MKKLAFGFTLAIMLSGTAAFANECPALPKGMECHAENGDGLAMYLVGRQAYEQGREDGDFSKAYKWAQRAMDAKFFPAAKMLYKMVHLQVGDGKHHDLVESHRWLTIAIDRGADYLVPWKPRLEARMTPEQLAEAYKVQ